MSWIVIETHGGPEYAIIVTNEEGENLIFNTHEKAITEALECQAGIIVEI
jgi:hypothetical protein